MLDIAIRGPQSPEHFLLWYSVSFNTLKTDTAGLFWCSNNPRNSDIDYTDSPTTYSTAQHPILSIRSLAPSETTVRQGGFTWHDMTSKTEKVFPLVTLIMKWEERTKHIKKPRLMHTLNSVPDLDPVGTVRTCHQSLQVIAACVVGWSLVDFLWRMLQHTNWDIPVQNTNWGCTKQWNWNTHVHKAEHLEYTCAKQKLGLYKIQHNLNTHVYKTSGIYLCKTATGTVQNTQQLEYTCT